MSLAQAALRRAASALVLGPVVGDVTSLAVRNATPIDPSAVADAGNGIGADGNGWAIDLTIKGLSPDANKNAFDGQKLTLVVNDPGFDTSGNPTTVTRTIKGSIAVRRQYPNNTQRIIAAVSGDLKLTAALDQTIYAGTTIVSATVAAGLYPGANAMTIPGSAITNNSTLVYPKPLFGWLNPQRERATGSSLAVEAVAYHEHGRNGQMVACVEFFGKDAAGHTTASQFAGAPSLSAFQTKGNIVESWKASIPLAALDQTTGSTTAANLPTVDAKIYPWIGDSSAILQLSVDGFQGYDMRCQRVLQFCNDKTGAYGGVYAYVSPNATTGAVSLDPATARTTPFLTLPAALTAIAAYNNANKGHNDNGGGIVRLMDNAGSPYTHLSAALNYTATGITYVTIEADPLNAAAITVRPNTTGNCDVPGMLHFRNLTILANNGTSGLNWSVYNLANTYFRLDNVTVDLSAKSGGNNVLFYLGVNPSSIVFARNCTLANVGQDIVGGFANTYFLGCTGTLCGVAGAVRPQLVVGNDVTNSYIGEGATNAAGFTWPGSDGAIVANNILRKHSLQASKIGNGYTYTKGFALVQNVVEIIGGNSVGIFLIGAEGGSANLNNIWRMYNTIVGDRGNSIYMDDSTVVGFKKRSKRRFDLAFSSPVKQDPFTVTTTLSGRVGNWEYAYDVGNKGNVTLAGAATAGNSQGTVNHDADPDGVNWQGNWVEPGTVACVAVHVGPGPGAWTTAAVPVNFVTDGSFHGANAGVGVTGDYHLTGSVNAAYNRVPAGFAMLKYDMAGVVRKNDGAGAAGAYERTV